MTFDRYNIPSRPVSGFSRNFREVHVYNERTPSVQTLFEVSNGVLGCRCLPSSDPARLALRHVSSDEKVITLSVQAIAPSGSCPDCGQPSTRVHSRYVRTPADLPWQGRAVRIELHIRRFFCSRPGCPRKTFSERLPELVAAFARSTLRLQGTQRLIGQALGGEPGSRLATALGLPVSPDTLLRRIRGAPLPKRPAVRVLGVNDWAWRKGRRYGTILCDLERRCPVDCFPSVRPTPSHLG